MKDLDRRAFVTGASALAAAPLFTGWSPRTDRRAVHDHLIAQLKSLYAARRERLQRALASPEDLSALLDRIRQDYRELLGPLPEPTPLEPEITGVIPADGYRIEKVIYQSRPRHRVTANLYVPYGLTSPAPGVLLVCGHSEFGKAYESYQLAALLLVTNGFVVLAVDPICQGERFQVLDSAGRPATSGGTTTHTLLDVGANLLGTDVVTWELWDNRRGMDYLISRPEVDPDRIGLTGNSGGGTQTAFLMAHDERVVAAAPSCYITTRERLFDSIGPQDGCQELPGEAARLIDIPDYVHLRAPRPTLILAARRDYFDFRGTREVFEEAKQVWTALGAPDRVDLFSYDDKHGFSRPRREAMAGFMRRWLMDDDTPVIEPDLMVQKEKDLWCTATGQVGSAFPDERSVTEILVEQANRMESERERFFLETPREQWQDEVSRLSGVRNSGSGMEIEIAWPGPIYLRARVETQLGDWPPRRGLILSPRRVTAAPVLFLDGNGSATRPGPEVYRLVGQGSPVMTLDLSGFGATRDDPRAPSNHRKYLNREHRLVRLALQLDRPLLGIRAGEIMAALDHLLGLAADSQAAHVWAKGPAALAALHAAVLDPRIGKLTLIGPLRSWLDTVASPLTPDRMTNLAPRALTRYDLPQLLQAIAPRPVAIEG